MLVKVVFNDRVVSHDKAQVGGTFKVNSAILFLLVV